MKLPSALLAILISFTFDSVFPEDMKSHSRLRALGKGKGKTKKESKGGGKTGGENNTGQGCNGAHCDDPNRTGGSNYADVTARSEQCTGTKESFLLKDYDEFLDQSDTEKEPFRCTLDNECNTCCCWGHSEYNSDGTIKRHCANADGLTDSAFGGCVEKDIEIPQGNNTGQVP